VKQAFEFLDFVKIGGFLFAISIVKVFQFIFGFLLNADLEATKNFPVSGWCPNTTAGEPSYFIVILLD
jgi:hypothetical protein